MVTKEKRVDYWNYLTNERTNRPKGVTPKRLEKIMTAILADCEFWFQVISRFGAEHLTAAEFYQEEHRSRSDNSRSQFWAMVREKLQSGTAPRE